MSHKCRIIRITFSLVTPIIIKFSGSKHLPNNSKCSAYGIQISKLPVGGGKLISEHFLKVLLNREGSLKVLTHDLVFATKQRLQSTFQWKEIDLGRQTCHNQGQSTLVCWCVGWTQLSCQQYTRVTAPWNQWTDALVQMLTAFLRTLILWVP